MRIILYACSVVLLSSCTLSDSNIFDDVITSYQQDSQKQKAAIYLKEHSKYHYGVIRKIHNVDDAIQVVENAENDSICRHHLDSIGCKILTESIIWDKDALTKEYIYKNIELAFDSWRNPWSRSVSFDDFCKYILPYRNGDEELHDWRKYFKDKYEAAITDSVSDPTSIKEVAVFLIKQLRKEIAYGPRMGVFSRKMLTTSNMEVLHWMDCMGCAHYVTLAMRACGIPCTMITNYWRFTEVPHTTVLFPAVGNNKNAFRLTIGDEFMEMTEPKDTMAVWYCWSRSYEANPDLLELLDDYETSGHKYEALKNFALPVTREDVTPLMSTTYDFSLPVPDSLRNRHHLFLCRFHNWKWYPIRAGKVIEDSVLFKNASIRQWYRLGYADADSVKTFGGTFTLVGDSGMARSHKKDIIRPYDLSGDTVLFKMVYGCDKEEKHLTREITTYYWNGRDDWHPYTQKAVLWGFNEQNSEYKIFDESLRGTFKPVFHLLQVRLPKWTIFTDNETPRPLGYLFTDKETGEGCFMQF